MNEKESREQNVTTANEDEDGRKSISTGAKSVASGMACMDTCKSHRWIEKQASKYEA